MTGVVGLISWPLVRGYGRFAGNPPILPRDYGTGLAVVLGLVWIVTLASAALAVRHRVPARERMHP